MYLVAATETMTMKVHRMEGVAQIPPPLESIDCGAF